MKSTSRGFWPRSVTLRNALIACLAPPQTLSLATFFWTFAALIFAVIASFYRGRSYLHPAEAAK